MNDVDNDGRMDAFYNDLMTQLLGLLRNAAVPADRVLEVTEPR